MEPSTTFTPSAESLDSASREFLERVRALRIPEDVAKRNPALARQLREQHQSYLELVERALTGAMASPSAAMTERGTGTRSAGNLPRVADLMQKRPTSTAALNRPPITASRPISVPTRPVERLEARPKTKPDPRPRAVPHRSAELPSVVARLAGMTKPNRSEWTGSIRWWSAPIALAASVLVAGTVGIVSVENLNVHARTLPLAKVLENPSATPDEIRQAAQALPASPLVRWDARREQLLAQAALRTMDPNDPARIATRDRHFERALERATGSAWYQVQVALTADGADPRWQSFASRNLPEPSIQEAVLFHTWSRDGDPPMDKLRGHLAAYPERSGSVVDRLLAKGLSPAQAVDLVPDTQAAVESLIELDRKRHPVGLASAIEVRLTQLEQHATSLSDPEEKSDAVDRLNALRQGWAQDASENRAPGRLTPMQAN